MKDYTEKILEEFEKDIKPMIENEVLYRYDNLELAQDSADTLNKGIRQFLSTSIAQALAEERERVMGVIRNQEGASLPDSYSMDDDIISKADLLSSLDKSVNKDI